MKLRICYAKTAAGRYLSHLDLARTMERSLRRAGVPLAFSEGFNPHPKLSFGPALAVGITGDREYVDIELRRRVNSQILGQKLQEALPPALALVALEEIDPRSKSLSALINEAVYTFLVDPARIEEAGVRAGTERILAASELWRAPKEKPGKKPGPAKEVRHLLREIKIRPGRMQEDPAGASRTSLLELELRVVLNNEGQLRPQEVWQMIAQAGGFEPEPLLEVGRKALLIRQDGKAFSPMEGV